jgi:hypothetical protein
MEGLVSEVPEIVAKYTSRHEVNAVFLTDIARATKRRAKAA